MGEIKEVIPEQETASESVKMSELCIGLNHMIKPPSNTVTGITMTVQPAVTNNIAKKMQLVTNTTLNIIQPYTGTYIRSYIQIILHYTTVLMFSINYRIAS